MFAPERIRIIKKMIKEKRRINVSDLSVFLNVSEVTIRRDLEKLEEQNFLTRTHGGAIINEISQPEEDKVFTMEEDLYVQQRMEIAEIAYHLVEDNEVIILSSGLTNLYIAKKLLAKKNLTILTNDLNIAYELSINPINKVVIPGGDINPLTMTLSGKLTEENIKSFYVSKAFIEVDGVSFERGYTVQNLETATVLNVMLSITKENIIVCPHNCFDNIAFSQLGPISLSTQIITNPSIPNKYKNYFFENSIKLFTAYSSYEGGISNG
jgi:DeoR family transcriptional regulator, fructose operon transcriptional repressor